MAKKGSSAEPWDLDAEVKKALVTIATADGPMRFVGKGDYAAVFSKNDAKTKEIVEKCLEARNPLAVEVGTAKKLKAELTPIGVLHVLGDIPEEKAAALVGIAAEKQPLEDRMVFVRQVAEKVALPDSMIHDLLTKPIEEKKLAAEKAQEEELRKVEVEQRRRHTQDLVIQENKRYADAVAEERAYERAVLEAKFRALGATPPAPLQPVAPPTNPTPLPKLPMATNDDEKDFRRLYARRLVSAWHQAIKEGNRDGQRFLEAALYNLDGIHAIGEPGETVKFDPKIHDRGVGIAPGTAVSVIHSGWTLQEGQTNYLILKAVVE